MKLFNLACSVAIALGATVNYAHAWETQPEYIVGSLCTSIAALIANYVNSGDSLWSAASKAKADTDSGCYNGTPAAYCNDMKTIADMIGSSGYSFTAKDRANSSVAAVHMCFAIGVFNCPANTYVNPNGVSQCISCPDGGRTTSGIYGDISDCCLTNGATFQDSYGSGTYQGECCYTE